MKKDSVRQKLGGMSATELFVESYKMRAEFFDLKLAAVRGHVKDNSQFKKLRKNIARALTLLGKMGGKQ